MNPIEERYTRERFRSLYRQFPEGKISQPDKPDFLIQGEKTFGIEVTQVFKDQDHEGGSVIRAKDTFRRNLLMNIVNGLLLTDFPKCIIAIHLNDQFYSKNLNARIISNVCIEDIMSRRKIIRVDGEYNFENEGKLPDVIEGYSISVYRNLEQTSFIETTGAKGHALTNQFIQYILNKKEKAKGDFLKCDFFWLLIKEGDFEGDYFGALATDTLQLKTSFDKVFLLRRRNEELIELK